MPASDAVPDICERCMHVRSVTITLVLLFYWFVTCMYILYVLNTTELNTLQKQLDHLPYTVTAQKQQDPFTPCTCTMHLLRSMLYSQIQNDIVASTTMHTFPQI